MEVFVNLLSEFSMSYVLDKRFSAFLFGSSLFLFIFFFPFSNLLTFTIRIETIVEIKVCLVDLYLFQEFGEKA